MMSKQEKRLDRIIGYLKTNNPSTINRLADTLGVSHMTIRRDIGILEDQNKVEIFHGGVLLIDRSSSKIVENYSLANATAVMQKEKEKIGKKAASLINTNAAIILDTGSTTEFISRFLPQDFSCSVVCFTLNVLINISTLKNAKIIFPGGYFHKNTLMFESREGLEILKKNRASVAFVSASGVSLSMGVTCSNGYERDTKEGIMKYSETKILVTDSSKFGEVHSTYFAEIPDFDAVITDSGIPEEYKNFFEDHNITVHIV